MVVKTQLREEDGAGLSLPASAALAAGKEEPQAGEVASAGGSRTLLTWREDPGGQQTAAQQVQPLCALGRQLVASSGSDSIGDGLPPGELLRALVGAHDRWELDASVATALRQRLRPPAFEVRPEWGLKPHQEEGYRWLMARSALGLGCILADDMGLGKTRLAIAWLLGVRASLLAQSAALAAADAEPKQEGGAAVSAAAVPLGGADQDFAAGGAFHSCPPCGRQGCKLPRCAGTKWERALVLAPSMLVRGEESVWIKELRDTTALWGVHLRVWQWHGERALRLRDVAHTSQWSGPMLELFDVVVVSYDSFLLYQDEFCSESWTCVILDEAQAIKYHMTQIAAAVKRLAKVPYRLALSGSPIENSCDDLHSILQFVQPDCAGSLQDFRQRFSADDAGKNMLRRLFHLVALRREATAGTMVPKEELDVSVGMTEVQRQIYRAVSEHQDFSPFKRLFSLELLCTHPWCYVQRRETEAQIDIPERFLGPASEQRIEDSGKLMELFAILRGILAQGEKVLVFFCRTVTGELLSALIEREFGMAPGLVRGDTPGAERERAVRDFRTEPAFGTPARHQVLLLSVWLGALGLNLPEARWVVHAERVWNPQLERQATSRVHRITSRRPVKAYSLCTEGSVEEQKRAVLRHKRGLSSHIVEALDGDLGDGEAGAELDSGALELQDLLAAATAHSAGTADAELEAEAALAEEGPEARDEAEDESGHEDAGSDRRGGDHGYCGPFPDLALLRPPQWRTVFYPGKYGDPSDRELWQWYTARGGREVHPRALLSTTASLVGAKRQRTGTTAPRLASRPSRINDIRTRGDWEVSVDFGDGHSSRLFIPEQHREHFYQDGHGKLGIRLSGDSIVPVPIFTPSCGRSALDSQVGHLDLTGTMVDGEGRPLRFLQIVAVKPSEVERYRTSAPFFTVMELPRTRTVDHPAYGSLKADELGIGFSRHWLMRLADALGCSSIFMLDDSVRAWQGVTLIRDPHSLFGRMPGSKAQFTTISLGQVLQYFSQPAFFEGEFGKFSVLGFPRWCPDLYLTKKAYRRESVYSAFFINIRKVLHEQKQNFREELFVWEDLEFNQRVQDVCKCKRFAMVKYPYSCGGCSQQVARAEVPGNRRVMNSCEKLSPEGLAAEAMGVAKGAAAAKRAAEHSGAAKAAAAEVLRQRPGKRLKVKQELEAEVAAAAASLLAASAELCGRSQFDLENDPVLKPESAVCDEHGSLMRSYYKRFVAAFKEKERSHADPAAPTGQGRNRHPGRREGEALPEGLRVWDDTRGSRGGRGSGADHWGAGWVAMHPYRTNGKLTARWFNVKIWGSWRLAFILSRLQRATWSARHPQDAGEATPQRGNRAERAGKERSATKQAKRRVVEHRMRPAKKMKLEPQSTLLNFFDADKKPQPRGGAGGGGNTSSSSAAPQQTICAFFKTQRVKQEECDEAEAAGDDVQVKEEVEEAEARKERQQRQQPATLCQELKGPGRPAESAEAATEAAKEAGG